MTTPIQQTIENIEEYGRIDIFGPRDIYDRGYLAGLDRATAILNSLLPKEKEIIKKIFQDGYTDCFINSKSLNSKYESPEDYYNQTFKQ